MGAPDDARPLQDLCRGSWKLVTPGSSMAASMIWCARPGGLATIFRCSGARGASKCARPADARRPGA